MISSNNKKISVSLTDELLAYAESYQQQYKLKSRSEVISEAIRALRERELIVDYKAMAQDLRQLSDLYIDSDIAEGLEPSTEENW